MGPHQDPEPATSTPAGASAHKSQVPRAARACQRPGCVLARAAVAPAPPQLMLALAGLLSRQCWGLCQVVLPTFPAGEAPRLQGGPSCAWGTALDMLPSRH